MKKLFTIAVVLFIAVSASAQLKIEVGGNYGGFSNNVTSRNPANSFLSAVKSDFGFTGGVMYDINLLDDALFLEPGVNYIMNNIIIKDTNEKMKTQWIQIPLTVGYSTNVGFGSVDAFIGLYYGRAVLQDGDFNENDFGFTAKVGYALPVGIGLFINYKHGFIDLSKTSGYRAFSNLVSFGLYFKFGGK